MMIRESEFLKNRRWSFDKQLTMSNCWWLENVGKEKDDWSFKRAIVLYSPPIEWAVFCTSVSRFHLAISRLLRMILATCQRLAGDLQVSCPCPRLARLICWRLRFLAEFEISKIEGNLCILMTIIRLGLRISFTFAHIHQNGSLARRQSSGAESEHSHPSAAVNAIRPNAISLNTIRSDVSSWFGIQWITLSNLFGYSSLPQASVNRFELLQTTSNGLLCNIQI